MGIIRQIIDEPVYFAKRNSALAFGKSAAESAAHSLAGAITPNAVTQAGAASAALGGTLAGLTLVGLASGVSAGLVQVDYYHKRNNLKEWYKEELAAKLKKTPGKVIAADLDMMAKGDPAKGIEGNRAIDEELRKSKRERNFGIVFSVIATMAALAAIAVLPTLIPALPESTSLFHLASYSLQGIGSLLVKAAAGVFTYNAVKIPLHWTGDKLFGLDKETTHDRIISLKRDHEAGKIISPEQVLSVFVGANRPLDRFIAAQYGQPFDKLDLADKQRAVDDLEKMIPLERLTSDINSGKINATELAFAVDGQISGVEHEGSHHHKKHGLWAKIRSALHFKPHSHVEMGAMTIQSSEANVAVAYAEENSSKSFVKRLGRSKMDPSVGYVKQLEQQTANTPLSQTIH